MDDHDSGSLPLRLCPRASPPVGGGVSLHEGGFPAAHIPRRVRLASMRRRSAGAHPKWKRKTKRPGSFAESGPLEFRERLARRSDAVASRQGTILGLVMQARLSVRQAMHAQRIGAGERTRAGEGFGVAKGDPAVHDGS